MKGSLRDGTGSRGQVSEGCAETRHAKMQKCCRARVRQNRRSWLSCRSTILRYYEIQAAMSALLRPTSTTSTSRQGLKRKRCKGKALRIGNKFAVARDFALVHPGMAQERSIYIYRTPVLNTLNSSATSSPTFELVRRRSCFGCVTADEK